MSKTTLYRFYDDKNELLYVGISLNPKVRFHSHGRKDWWDGVRHGRLEHFGTRQEAEAAEQRAIKNEHPQLNIVHVPAEEVARRKTSRKPIPTSGVVTYENDHHRKFATCLRLAYEVSGSAISDFFTPADISAEDLYWEWRERHPSAVVSISWFIEASSVGHFEAAPFAASSESYAHRTFLDVFTWPIDSNGERINWLTLPVKDLADRKSVV